MTVSIVIPCYNQAPFVAEAIRSALAQTHEAIEVIVVNDGSTDDAAAIIDRTVDGHVNVEVITQANRGLSAARNAGLRASQGDIVIFLDADDRLTPAAARAACDSLRRHPEAMMTFGRCLLIDASGAPMPTDLPVVEPDLFETLLGRNVIWTPAMAAFRRELFTLVGPFNRDVNASADYDLYLRIARLLPIASHSEVVAHYRQHDASMSRDPVAMLTATLTVLRAQRGYVAAQPRLAAAYADGQRAWRSFYGEQLVERFRSALHSRRYRCAIRDAVRLLRFYPRGVAQHLAKKSRVLSGLEDLRSRRPIGG